MPGRPSGRRAARWGCATILVLVWLPALVFAAGITVARWTGCRATEAQAEPCIVAGMDIGHRLYTMAMTGWVVIALLPLMLLSLIVILVLSIRRIARHRSIMDK